MAAPVASLGQSLSSELASTLEPLVHRSAGVLTTRMIHETATLDAQGHLRGVTTRLVVEAASGFPDRYIAVYFGVEGSSSGLLSMRHTSGCRVGRVRRHATAPIIAAEMLFSAPLMPGQHHVLEDETTDRGRAMAPFYSRLVPKGTSSAVLTAVFDAGRVPARCFGRFGDEEPQEVSLGADLAAHLLSVEQGAASLELSWEWGGMARSRRVPSR
ncbi:hypothetical protein BJF86_00100 [Serinicoccus sp. CNJ-927]|uniref:hypothetical protein n=1 Tax=Serinicoccus sp. CNJ-927 TaxID=1904970 RepID=UPI0009636706|nr:hypothetical protein [Serinicoccus sp. CNJ-927]OLT43262.1 hypothetical protein BJF86_00100 [Serinicoccus sp. CNJ-927]